MTISHLNLSHHHASDAWCQVNQFKLADMATSLTSSRLMVCIQQTAAREQCAVGAQRRQAARRTVTVRDHCSSHGQSAGNRKLLPGVLEGVLEPSQCAQLYCCTSMPICTAPALLYLYALCRAVV